MKTATLFAICLCSFTLLQAQINKPPAKDTLSHLAMQTNKSILVVPFEPMQYFNDGDQFICRNNNITPAELEGVIRKSLAHIIVDDLGGMYRSRAISDTVMGGKKSDMNLLYSMTKYSMENKPLKGHQTNIKNNSLESMINLSGRQKGKDYISDNKDIKKTHRYFKAQFMSDSVAAIISKHYSEDYYLFISHFEMETRYKDCHDMANNAFQRDMYVHYTLIDAKNNFVDGGVVCVTFESSDREIDKILEKNFSILSSMIIGQIKTKI